MHLSLKLIVRTLGAFVFFIFKCGHVLAASQCCLGRITTSSTECPRVRQYCIVGAGPAGLQMGYFFGNANRDYIIFEKSNISGNFFARFPRHRKLISINKRFTGKTNREFNMRHDWNSLLSDDDTLLFRHYSKDFFPSADTMVRYLNEFQQKRGIWVQYDTHIRNIQKRTSSLIGPKSSSSSSLLFSMEDQRGTTYWCRNVIVATGLWKFNQPSFKGAELTIGYSSVPIDARQFEGKNVLILGRGNSAFETADAIYGHTNLVHMVSRSRARLSWSTHYVGDLRAINNGLLDTYQLKSLDGLLEAPVEDLALERRGERIYVQFPWQQRDDVNSSQVAIGGRGESDLDNFSLREGYDYVISCLGFLFDDALFHNSTRPLRAKGRKAKYPAIRHTYESLTIPGLYFAGTVTHSLDYRKSAGGFIHGFRYTARVLHRILEYRNHGSVWPSYGGLVADLLNFIVKRINEAAGLYQMFGTLADIIALRLNGTTHLYEVYEEFPTNLLHQFTELTGHEVDRIIVMLMEYGPDFSGPDKDTFRPDRATGDPLEAHRSNFLHPVFYYFDRLPTESEMLEKPRGWCLPRPKRLHHVLEDFLTSWTAPQSHILPLRRFLEYCIDQDLRHFFAESCFKYSLMSSGAPITCQTHYWTGQGLFPPTSSSSLLSQ